MYMDETTELTWRKPEEQVKSWVLEYKDHMVQVVSVALLNYTFIQFDPYTLRNNVWHSLRSFTQITVAICDNTPLQLQVCVW